MRASVRSRRRCRMISCPAANEIRWVNPSIATVSPSWTSSATASCIVVTLLELIRLPSISGSAEHAELVALDVLHHGPERRLAVDRTGVLLDEIELRGTEPAQAIDLFAHRAGGSQVQVHPVLRRLRLGHRLEEDPARLPARVGDVGARRVGVDQVVAERGGPERRHADGVACIEGERVGRQPHYAPASTSATTSSKSSSAACAWSSRNTSGGLTRTSASPQPRIKSPLRNEACSIAAAWSWSANVMPIQNARPRTSVMIGWRDWISRRPPSSTSPTAVAFSIRPSSWITSNVARDAAHDTGEPP